MPKEEQVAGTGMLRSAAYLDAFVRVERHLRGLVDGRRDETFGALLSRASATSAVVRRFADDLREYADLRNAIVHERRGGEPIAEPHDQTINDLQRIAGIIADPPRVNQLGTMNVVTCAPETPIGTSAREMLAGDFSQLPVYREREFVDLLTSETIARWLGSELERHGGILEEQPVSAVLQFREPSSLEKFIGRDRIVIEVIDLFETTARDGKNLDAVIVTQNGTPRETPLYILTVFDLPRLYQIGFSKLAA